MDHTPLTNQVENDNRVLMLLWDDHQEEFLNRHFDEAALYDEERKEENWSRAESIINQLLNQAASEITEEPLWS